MSIQAASLSLPALVVAAHAPAGHHAPAVLSDNGGGHDQAAAAVGTVTEARGNTVNTTA